MLTREASKYRDSNNRYSLSSSPLPPPQLVAIDLTNDHKPTNELERARILKSGSSLVPSQLASRDKNRFCFFRGGVLFRVFVRVREETNQSNIRRLHAQVLFSLPPSIFCIPPRRWHMRVRVYASRCKDVLYTYSMSASTNRHTSTVVPGYTKKSSNCASDSALLQIRACTCQTGHSLSTRAMQTSVRIRGVSVSTDGKHFSCLVATDSLQRHVTATTGWYTEVHIEETLHDEEAVLHACACIPSVCLLFLDVSFR